MRTCAALLDSRDQSLTAPQSNMKYGLLALLAASTVLGHGHGHNHKHRRSAYGHGHGDALFTRSEDCACSTYVTSRVYAVTIPAAAPSEVTKTVVPIYETNKPACPGGPDCPAEKPPTYKRPLICPGSPDCPKLPIPTPDVITAVTPGIYTIPAKTLTLTKTVTTVVPKVTQLTPGPNTYGGVTTVVTTSTTVTCPVATVVTEDDVTISKVTETTYVCPTPGTYHIGATTTIVQTSTEVVCPEPTVYPPGTYSHPESTVTLTATNQVYVCPLETDVPAVPTPVAHPTSVPSHPVEKPEEKPYVPAVPPHAAPSVAPPAISSVVPPAASSAIPSAVPSTPAKVPVNHGDGLWSITYNPFTDAEECFSKEQMQADIATIAKKGFKAVRIYSSECFMLDVIGPACEAHGLLLTVGIWITGNDVSTGNRDLSAIIEWGKWNVVEMIVVGNEAIFKEGGVSPDALVSYISFARSKLQAAGYNGPITTTETIKEYKNYPVLCGAVDLVGINIHPFYNGHLKGYQSGDHIVNTISEVKAICPGKEVRVLEAGWPSNGAPYENSIASPSEQAAAMKSIAEKAGSITTFFDFRNSGWKKGHDAEKSFGCIDLF